MKLIDLSPCWVTPDMFIFKSPTGSGDWLSCKRVPMSYKEQCAMLNANPDTKGRCVVTTVDWMAWEFKGSDFDTMTVHPSIDASKSGNWHGFVTNGEIITC